MMRQYLEVREANPDCILFFRLGDFYEMFFEDAITVSRELELTLTGKSCGLDERAPMCGVPHHASDTYIARLIEKGYRVAICEQTEDPAQAKGLVKREVTRIVTPGTLVSQTMLKESTNNYIASIYADENVLGAAYSDISTGELVVTEYRDERSYEDLLNEMIKLDVRELIVPEKWENADFLHTLELQSGVCITKPGGSFFDRSQATGVVSRQFHVKTPEGLGLDPDSSALCALGGLLSYLFETQKQSLEQLTHIRIEDHASHMVLDKAAIRNLELTETLFEKKIDGSLLGVLDRTCTAMGSRKLKKWIREPLNHAADIQRRLDAVEFLYDEVLLRNDLREALKRVYDLERLTGRIASGNANGRDLIAMKQSLTALPDILSMTDSCEIPLLMDLSGRMQTFDEVTDRIERALVEDPPVTIREGGMFRAGYSKELDSIKEAASGSLEWITGLEAAERERTGIKNLKVGFNRVFGYYIEITKSNLDHVPQDYIRKQTLVHSERYVTQELKEMESVVMNAETRIHALEYQLYLELRDYLKSFTGALQETADAVAELDVLISFAEISSKNGYVKPLVNNGDEIRILEGRHPVIEQKVDDGIFVANDTLIDRSEQSFLLITGPNMSGKSTYMRQTALIVLMAQMGCFVPASEAEIGVVDRIYTRIGASDNLSQGQSTFFVEMSELANILNTATERSLVILDEIGRGTSTYDGLSIAWAVVDNLCGATRRVRTLFASHYHELTVLEDSVPGFRNLNVSVSEETGDIVFLHRIAYGSASRSYGIHVAKIAGVPESVLRKAQEKLTRLEKNTRRDEILLRSDGSSPGMESDRTTHQKENPETAKPGTDSEGTNPDAHGEPEAVQLSFLTFMTHPVVEKLRTLDIMSLTPSGAIRMIEELKAAAEEQR